MQHLLSLVQSYLNNEMFTSALLLSEYIYNTTKSQESLLLIIKSLFNLKYYERCIDLIDKQSDLLEYTEIKRLYYRSQTLTLKATKKLLDVVKSSRHIKKYNSVEISDESVELLFKALTREDIRRKDILIEAYNLDMKNMEALCILKIEGLVSDKEFDNLVKNSGEMETIYKAIFDPNIQISTTSLNFYSPWYGMLLAQKFYKNKKKNGLFNLGAEMYRLYPNSEYSFICLGLYFLMLSEYSEARKCFYKAVQINTKYGRSWMYLGITYSGMKECESCISCLRMANKSMIGCYIPSFYLAMEFHRMNNFDQASFFYKQALKLNYSPEVQERYVTLLIYFEYYTEALSYLATQKSPAFDLLRVYCNLFLGKVADAQKYLSGCVQDWRYYATAGFIDHLMSSLFSAANNYNIALTESRMGILEELLGLAIENSVSKHDNNVYEYATDLFDTILPKYSFDVV